MSDKERFQLLALLTAIICAGDLAGHNRLTGPEVCNIAEECLRESFKRVWPEGK